MALIDNILSYWKLDESSGDAADSAGSITATNSNVTYSAGKINNGANFNGSTSKLTLGANTNFNFSSDFSVSAWIKFTGVSEYGIVVKGKGGAYQWGLMTDGTKVDMNLWQGGGEFHLTALGTTAINNGNWHFVVGTYKASTTTLTIYVDGSSDGVDSTAAGAWAISGAAAPIIGARDEAGFFMDGSIDEVGIWNTTLTQTEINQLYNSGNGLSYPFPSSIISPFPSFRQI